jgi:hypothetical protein
MAVDDEEEFGGGGRERTNGTKKPLFRTLTLGFSLPSTNNRTASTSSCRHTSTYGRGRAPLPREGALAGRRRRPSTSRFLRQVRRLSLSRES